MRIQLWHTFEEIISIENLLLAWPEFLQGKRNKPDVQLFERHLMDNLLALHEDLASGRYVHGGYKAFRISDPKPRQIHKASVRDRVLHHAIYRQLYPFFDKTFIADSFSCRIGKGTHKALDRFREFGGKVSRNHTRTCWVLKCDIKKFFASIDQAILLGILEMYIPDQKILELLQIVIGSFSSTEVGKGLPLGNLTSQLLVNIYMNEFDQWVKHKLKNQYYIRYADDFVFLSDDKEWLEEQIPTIGTWLAEVLGLRLHPDKVFIKTFASGVDFLGWVHFADHQVPRPATVRRMKRNLAASKKPETLQSYVGLMNHGNAKHLMAEIVGEFADRQRNDL
jgi:retron-type reverse transcriptase